MSLITYTNPMQWQVTNNYTVTVQSGSGLSSLQIDQPYPTNSPEQQFSNISYQPANASVLADTSGYGSGTRWYTTTDLPGQGQSRSLAVSYIDTANEIHADKTALSSMSFDAYDTQSADYLRYTKREDDLQTDNWAIAAVAKQLKSEYANPYQYAQAAYNFVTDHMTYLEPNSVPFTAADSLLAGQGQCQHYAILFVALCRAGGIPARVASGNVGLSLDSDSESRGLHAWGEFLLPGVGWIPADTTWGDLDYSSTHQYWFGNETSDRVAPLKDTNLTFCTTLGTTDYEGGTTGSYNYYHLIPSNPQLNGSSNLSTSLISGPYADLDPTTSVGSWYTSFSVNYLDDTGIDTSTVNDGEILVTGPNGFSQTATYMGNETSTMDGKGNSESYYITPGGGSWNTSNSGTYTVSIVGNKIKDTSGNYVPAGTLGTFHVASAPQIEASDAFTFIGAGTSGNDMVFTLRLSDENPYPVTVHYATADGTAKAGTDYTSVSGTVTFDAGVDIQTVSVPLADTAAFGQFSLVLSNPSGATLASSQAYGIVGNDLPSITVTDSSGDAADRSLAMATTLVGHVSATQTFTLTNSGNQPVDISGFAKGGSNAAEFPVAVKDDQGNLVSGGSFTIPVGKAYTVAVTLAPTTNGAKAANIVFNTNDSGNAAVTLTLAGKTTNVVVTPSAGALTYAEGVGAVTVDSGITVTDSGSATLLGATLKISSHYTSGQDVLGFTNQNGITGAWSASAGTLTLSGSASVADYQAALQTVTYRNTSANPSTLTRTVSVVANDGSFLSVAVTRAIMVTVVNNPPVVNANAASLPYTTNTGAVAVDPGITLTDADSASMVGATVTIAAPNYVSGEDTLSFVKQGTITGVWDFATGVLTLSGTATKAAYQAALRTVKYTDAGANPSLLDRTINFVANDGATNNNLSALAARSISMTYGYVNLAGVFGTGTAWTLTPSPVVTNLTKLKGVIPVVVSNLGSVPLPAGQQVNIVVEARDLTNPANAPVTLATLNKQSVSKLKANGLSPVTFRPSVAANTVLPNEDTYQIWANITPVQALAESESGNWVTDSTRTIISKNAFVDLQASFGKTLVAWTGDQTSGDGKTISVPVVVTNVGNVPLDPALKVNITINAVGAGLTTVPLKTLAPLSVASLGNGKSVTVTTTVTLPPGMASGDYNLQAVIDTTQVTGDTSAADNTFTTSGAAGTLNVTTGYVSLFGAFGSSTLHPTVAAGASLTGTVAVSMKNTGKVALPKDQTVDIILLAVDTANSAHTITLNTLTGVSLSALAANGAKSIPVPVSLTNGLTAGAYTLQATVTPTNNQPEFGTPTPLYTVLYNAASHPLNITVS